LFEHQKPTKPPLKQVGKMTDTMDLDLEAFFESTAFLMEASDSVPYSSPMDNFEHIAEEFVKASVSIATTSKYRDLQKYIAHVFTGLTERGLRFAMKMLCENARDFLSSPDKHTLLPTDEQIVRTKSEWLERWLAARIARHKLAELNIQVCATVFKLVQERTKKAIALTRFWSLVLSFVRSEVSTQAYHNEFLRMGNEGGITSDFIAQVAELGVQSRDTPSRPLVDQLE
jgi:hypothetical protein